MIKEFLSVWKESVLSLKELAFWIEYGAKVLSEQLYFQHSPLLLSFSLSVFLKTPLNFEELGLQNLCLLLVLIHIFKSFLTRYLNFLFLNVVLLGFSTTWNLAAYLCLPLFAFDSLIKTHFSF